MGGCFVLECQLGVFCTSLTLKRIHADPLISTLSTIQIEADSQDEIAESFDVEEVPTFLLLRGHTLLARHAGSNGELLVSLLKQHAKPTLQPALATASSASAPTVVASAAASKPPADETEEQLDARCKALMNKHKVVLFMKGNPSAPKCGFSRQTVGLLREKGVEFAWFDILSDEGVRTGLKKMNDWPSEFWRSVSLFLAVTLWDGWMFPFH